MKIKMTKEWTAILPEALRCLRDKWRAMQLDTREIRSFLQEFRRVRDLIENKGDTNGQNQSNTGKD